MKLAINNIEGKKIGEIAVPELLAKSSMNQNAVRQAVLAEMVNLRQGTHSSKNRSAVRGGGKKPWKQKGRGVARAGTIRSPLWKGGGTVFGPNPHKYRHKVSKKLSILARKSAFLDKLLNGKVFLLDKLAMENGKTSSFNNRLSSFGLKNKKVTLLVSDYNENLNRAVRNIPFVYMVYVSCVSIYELLDCEYLLMDEEGFNSLIQIFTR